jgi:hypothetical protein
MVSQCTPEWLNGYVCMARDGLYDFPATDDSEQDNHDRDYQKDVYETAHSVGTDQPHKPQYQQDRGNRVKHDWYPFILSM